MVFSSKHLKKTVDHYKKKLKVLQKKIKRLTRKFEIEMNKEEPFEE